jgi:chemotaxis protein methyltransferase CheR
MTAACISDPSELLRAIRAAGEIRDILITELTIGETYFLREIGQLNFLKNTVLPELRAGSLDRALRLWSAGCATGEEAYSLAMTLEEAAWPGAFSVLGTDLAFARWVAAKRARYTAWSMRGVSESIVARYFERHGKQFLLRADIRNAVEFRVLNLAAAD